MIPFSPLNSRFLPFRLSNFFSPHFDLSGTAETEFNYQAPHCHAIEFIYIFISHLPVSSLLSRIPNVRGEAVLLNAL